MKTCLFSGLNCSNIFNKEHIIQKGLGGTLKSANLICKSCNQYFANTVDPTLIEFYRPIIQIIEPLLSGDLKGKVRIRTSLSGEDDLKIHPGGHVEKRKNKKKYYEKEQKIEITAPLGISREEIEKTERRKAESFEEDCVEDEYREDILPTDTLLRAIVLDILKLIKYVCIKNNLLDLSNHEDLKDIKKWVRRGTPINYIPTTYPFSFAPISDIIGSIFNPCLFSHRLIVYFDCNENKILFVAEFINTMPWMVVIENVNILKTSLLIKYQKNLIPSGTNQEEPSIVYGTFLNWKDIEWRKFSTVSYKACEFAWQKFRQQYYQQIGRAQYEVDMRTEGTLLKDIGIIRLNYKEHDIPEKLPEIVSALIKSNRYRYHLCADEIKKICYQKAKSMSSKWDSNKKIEMNDIISVYRSCLKMIAEDPQYGYPQNVRPI